MALTYSNAAKQAATDAITALVNGGSGAGKLVIKDGSSPLISYDLSDPAFGAAASTGIATLDITPAITGTATGAGDADGFAITDSDDTVIFSGTVTATGGGGDLTLDNVNIAIGQTVTISSFTFKASGS
jgi:hypothetical protein